MTVGAGKSFARFATFEETGTDALIVLLDGRGSSRTRQEIRRALKTNLPTFVLTGSKPDASLLDYFRNQTVFMNSGAGKSVTPVPVQPHASFAAGGKWLSENETMLPPLVLGPKTSESMNALATDDGRDSGTVIYGSSVKGQRLLMLFAGGIWKWQNAMADSDPGAEDFKYLLKRMILWLTAADDHETVTLESPSDVVYSDEGIQLDIRILDESFEKVADAEIDAQVEHGDDKRALAFMYKGEGLYSSFSEPLGLGKHSVTAEIKFNGNIIHRELEIVVDPFSREKSETRMRPEPLRKLSIVTGGKFILPDDLGMLPDLLPQSSRQELVRSEWSLVKKWMTLLIIAGLLGVEWFIRTRRGMP